MRIIFNKLAVFLFGFVGFAQQDAQYTQYMYNRMIVNPAYAGSRDSFTIFAMNRNQWVGLTGAPVTSIISIDTSIPDSRWGVGLSFMSDKIGPTDEKGISANLAYSIMTSQDYKLSFGLKGNINILDVDFSKLSQFDPIDDFATQNINNRLLPNMGAGIYYYSEVFYVGLSVPNFFENKHFDSYSTTSIATERIHYNLITGGVISMNENVDFNPAMLLKAVNGAPLQVDLTANFMFNQKFILGAAYRLSSSVSGLIGVQFTKSWLAGYAYDGETTALANFNSGSHEIFLRYEFKNRDYNCCPAIKKINKKYLN